MALIEMKVPSPGESITEVELAAWLVSDGDWIEKDQIIAEIDSDKASLELPSEESGVITRKAEEGQTVNVGDVLCLIDTSAQKPEGQTKPKASKESTATEAAEKVENKSAEFETKPAQVSENESPSATPLAKSMMKHHGLEAKNIKPAGQKIRKKDVLSALSGGFDTQDLQGWGGTRNTNTKKMSTLRKKLAQRLVAVKNDTAMLTTFNEVNMKPIMDLRTQYKKAFEEKFGVGLGFMSFFTKAVTEALNHFPQINAQISDGEIIFHDYADIGIAVSSPKGLMVPIIRNAEQMSLAEIEAEIKRLATRARDGKISLEEMTGGTFTITNGGVFGSMMSTPIINPPQSAILGMHNIVERPMAVNGEVVILPMMYVAMSYDHRIVDGKESVSFLVKVKEMLEHPAKMLFGAKDPNLILLGL